MWVGGGQHLIRNVRVGWVGGGQHLIRNVFECRSLLHSSLLIIVTCHYVAMVPEGKVMYYQLWPC